MDTHTWWTLFNNRQLKQFLVSYQFYYIDWSAEESIMIKYNGGGSKWNVGQSLFGPTSPRVVTVDMGNGTFGNYMFKTFGNTGIGCSSEIINVISAWNGTNVARPTGAMGVNAAFEGCRNLKEIHGVDMSGCAEHCFVFDGCYSIETIPSEELGANWNMGQNMMQSFAHCAALTEIEPILDITNVHTTYAAFTGCTNLQTVHFKGLNAACNYCESKQIGEDNWFRWEYDWDFSDTKLSQDCVDYMVQNMVTTVDQSAEDWVRKSIGFPSGIDVNKNITINGQTDSILTWLYNGGWDVYVGRIQQVPAIT